MEIPWAIRIAALVLVFTLDSCAPSPRGMSTTPAGSQPSVDKMTLPPLGTVAGAFGSVSAMATANPYGSIPHGNIPHTVQQGRQLFVKMNCAGCHAYDGSGNMGPDLTDTYWRYGGLPIQIYKSIQEGRPEGMPSWGDALPPDELWALVAYIQSLGGSVSDSAYNHARQGDQPGERIAPEAQADAQPAARQKP